MENLYLIPIDHFARSTIEKWTKVITKGSAILRFIEIALLMSRNTEKHEPFRAKATREEVSNDEKSIPRKRETDINERMRLRVPSTTNSTSCWRNASSSSFKTVLFEVS